MDAVTASQLIKFLETLPPDVDIEWEVNGGEYGGSLELTPDNVRATAWENVNAIGERIFGATIEVSL